MECIILGYRVDRQTKEDICRTTIKCTVTCAEYYTKKLIHKIRTVFVLSYQLYIKKENDQDYSRTVSLDTVIFVIFRYEVGLCIH